MVKLDPFRAHSEIGRVVVFELAISALIEISGNCCGSSVSVLTDCTGAHLKPHVNPPNNPSTIQSFRN